MDLVDLPLQDTAAFAFAQLGEDLQACSLDGLEVDTVVTVLGDGIGAVILYLLPFALGILVVERP